MRFCPSCGGQLREELREGKLRPTCPACGFIYFADPKVAAAVILMRDERVLLGRRINNPGQGCWSLPAGFVDRGEVVEDAARREAREELGVDITIDRLVGLYSAPGDPVVLAVYAGTVIDGTPTAADDLDAVGYFLPDALPELAFARDARILHDWLTMQRLVRP